MQRFNSIIQIRTGCIDCCEGNDSPIYALNRCPYHYKLFSLKARKKNIRQRDPQQSLEDHLLWTWYKERLKECKMRCEETGERIYPKEGKEHWHICHVLPKSIFKSVMVHPDNSIELGWQAHSDFDRYLENHDERLMHMRIFDSILMKIQLLKPFVKERRRWNELPLFILDKID